MLASIKHAVLVVSIQQIVSGAAAENGLQPVWFDVRSAINY